MDVVPVPAEYVHQVWEPAARICRWSGNDYDVNRLHQRLLVGRDLLWLALRDETSNDPKLPCYDFKAVIVTTITNRPPTQQKRFQTRDPAAARSLAVHLVSGTWIQSWIDCAVERITRYGLDQGCRKLFLMSRKGWQHYALQFGKGFDTVAYARDRPTVSHVPEREFESHWRQHFGFYREVSQHGGCERLLTVAPTTPRLSSRQGDSEFFRQLRARRRNWPGPKKKKSPEVLDVSLNHGR